MSGTMVSYPGYSKAPLGGLPVDFLQAGKIPPRPEAVPDIGDNPLYPGFVSGFAASGRVNDDAIMMCQLFVTRVKLGVIEIRLDYPGL